MTPTEWKESQLEVPKIGCVSHDCGYCQPKREWVGLNWDDLPEIYVGDTAFLHGAKWAEAKLKEKNHD